MKKSAKKTNKSKKVLLLEPNYPNKYPPVGLMKLATYHRRQGWTVVFFKGDLTYFVAMRLTELLIKELQIDLPDFNWGRWFGIFCNYIWKGRDSGLQHGISEWGESLSLVLTKIKNYRDKYRNGEYFKLKEWDRILITTLFTFYADITIETIKFAQQLQPSEIQVGGIMASVVPEYIEQKTGLKPSTGILSVKSIFKDKPLDTPIDILPLDYSILEEIDYRYPAEDAFFGHATRGCPNKCAFCVVPILEPEYQSFRSLKDKLVYERRMFGERSNLLLMDNNVFASTKFKEIVSEIQSVGFGNNVTVTCSDQLKICAARIKEDYNPRAYVKKGCSILLSWVERLASDTQKRVLDILLPAGILEDWHGVSNAVFLKVYAEILPYWEKSYSSSVKKVLVDFNQGLDSRLALKSDTMELLAQLPVRPVRIAFDHWNLRKEYENSIEAAAKVGFKQMSNYILYNFHDTPEELYWRLRLNVALCEELNVSIYSFPMKYHPIKDPAYFSNRDFLGEHWCRKYIRFVQLVLNSTMGKVGRGKTFFLKAFGESTEAFREMLLMPEYIIRNRFDCEACGETDKWRDALYSLSDSDIAQFKERLIYNDFKILDENRESKALRRLLAFYQTPSPEIAKISDERRKELVEAFDKKWRDHSARLTEEDICNAVNSGNNWPYQIDNDLKKFESR